MLIASTSAAATRTFNRANFRCVEIVDRCWRRASPVAHIHQVLLMFEVRFGSSIDFGYAMNGRENAARELLVCRRRRCWPTIERVVRVGGRTSGGGGDC